MGKSVGFNHESVTLCLNTLDASGSLADVGEVSASAGCSIEDPQGAPPDSLPHCSVPKSDLDWSDDLPEELVFHKEGEGYKRSISF